MDHILHTKKNKNTIYVSTNFTGDFEREEGIIILLSASFCKQKLNFKYILINGLKIHYSYTAEYHTYPDSAGDIFRNLA